MRFNVTKLVVIAAVVRRIVFLYCHVLVKSSAEPGEVTGTISDESE